MKIQIKGKWHIVLERNGKIIDERHITNLVPTQGLNHWDIIYFYNTTATGFGARQIYPLVYSINHNPPINLSTYLGEYPSYNSIYDYMTFTEAEIVGDQAQITGTGKTTILNSPYGIITAISAMGIGSNLLASVLIPASLVSLVGITPVIPAIAGDTVAVTFTAEMGGGTASDEVDLDILNFLFLDNYAPKTRSVSWVLNQGSVAVPGFSWSASPGAGDSHAIGWNFNPPNGSSYTTPDNVQVFINYGGEEPLLVAQQSITMTPVVYPAGHYGTGSINFSNS